MRCSPKSAQRPSLIIFYSRYIKFSIKANEETEKKSLHH